MSLESAKENIKLIAEGKWKKATYINYKGEPKPITKDHGLCNVLQERLNNRQLAVVFDIFDSWEHCGDSPLYPVPHTKLDSMTAYFNAKHMFDQRTEYGRKRIELAKYLLANWERIERETKA